MKILFIGNSFSYDASVYFYDLLYLLVRRVQIFDSALVDNEINPDIVRASALGDVHAVR